MIITIDKNDLIENIKSNINSKIDILLMRGEMEPSDYYITGNHISWIAKQLIYADFQVRKVISHILSSYDDIESELLKYDIKINHEMQTMYMPIMIEELLIEYVSDIWLADKSLLSSSKSAVCALNLQKVSHLSGVKRKIPYHLI